jgi:hypothetical protein
MLLIGIDPHAADTSVQAWVNANCYLPKISPASRFAAALFSSRLHTSKVNGTMPP